MEAVAAANIPTAWTNKARVFWHMPAGWKPLARRFFSFSQYNLRAGRFVQWHWGVVRYYLLATAIVIASAFDPRALLLIPAGFAARLFAMAWRKRDCMGGLRWSPRTVGLTAAITLLIDLATLAGIIAYQLPWLRDSRMYRTAAFRPGQNAPAITVNESHANT
jgi:hypothetical protein